LSSAGSFVASFRAECFVLMASAAAAAGERERERGERGSEGGRGRVSACALPCDETVTGPPSELFVGEVAICIFPPKPPPHTPATPVPIPHTPIGASPACKVPVDECGVAWGDVTRGA
jgi:hypothetical protein